MERDFFKAFKPKPFCCVGRTSGTALDSVLARVEDRVPASDPRLGDTSTASSA